MVSTLLRPYRDARQHRAEAAIPCDQVTGPQVHGLDVTGAQVPRVHARPTPVHPCPAPKVRAGGAAEPRRGVVRDRRRGQGDLYVGRQRIRQDALLLVVHPVWHAHAVLDAAQG